ncbi:hypothetical protein C1637_16835 [Chryseobacterium lactis]|uniref:Tail fiber protein n=1 Tax=Chryseobacterium lactis TaxID=1241981 RepID=A0A3G6RSS8_CHRLC|nr:hypothetical protein [Chryseobacterium lactis]AZA84154.1 hypothetical protein EG342_20675 [Chryseobacterium lactis]AZB04540.1 hypothetical protein EG341_11550 [Chryseobacterium lactis]PNW12709.1 hypothetical protein C1637_16835 [Chryseobacterium lactis]
MKKILLLGLVAHFGFAFSQIGINTPTPNATLDVVGKPSTTTAMDGIIPPRITGTQLKAKTYTTAQTGAFVYVTAADASPSGQTVDVTSSGYYYFDGTLNKWVTLSSTSTTGDPTPDAFIDDPTNSRVQLGTTSTGAARNAGSEFVVQDNGRVGIGTANPVSALQISENKLAGSNELRVSSANTAPRIVVDRLNASGNLSKDDELGRFVFNAKIAGASFPVAGIVSYYRGTGTTNSSSMVFRTSDSNQMIIDDAGRVSLGTTYSNASAILDLQTTDKGFLPPRVSLNSLNDGTTITSPTKGLMVYNTNTNTAQIPSGEGIYYNTGSFSAPVWEKASGGNTYGDIKSGLQTQDHNGWVKLDGRGVAALTASQRARANSLGFSTNLPNASNSYLVQNGTALGSISGANTKTISRNQLPDATLNGTTSSVAPNIRYDIINNGGRAATDTNSYTFLAGFIGSGTRNNAVVNTGVLAQVSHSHSFTTNSINGGVNQQALDTTPKSLSVNMFVYLGY